MAQTAGLLNGSTLLLVKMPRGEGARDRNLESAVDHTEGGDCPLSFVPLLAGESHLHQIRVDN